MHNCETTPGTKKRNNDPDDKKWEDIKGHKSYLPHILEITPNEPEEMPPVSALDNFPGCTIH